MVNDNDAIDISHIIDEDELTELYKKLYAHPQLMSLMCENLMYINSIDDAVDAVVNGDEYALFSTISKES